MCLRSQRPGYIRFRSKPTSPAYMPISTPVSAGPYTTRLCSGNRCYSAGFGSYEAALASPASIAALVR